MRIALYNLTNTTKYGGVESFVWDLANYLATRGHAVTVVGGTGPVRENSAHVQVQTFPYVDRDAFAWIPGLRRAYAERKLLERLSMALFALWYLIHQRFDIIHIQKPYDLLPALIAARFSGAKVILGCHGEDFYRGDRWLATHVDGAVSCSQFNADTVKRRYPIDIDVVYNGIDTALFTPPVQHDSLPDSPFKLLFVGRLQPWKGVDTAIRAIALLADTTEIATLFAQHHALVATSYASETFGIGLVEAQASGIPVIASRFGGFVEVVNDGQTGLFYTPRNHEELAAQITYLQQHPALRTAMAAAAPQWAQQFAWDAVTDRVEATYKSVCSRG